MEGASSDVSDAGSFGAAFGVQLDAGWAVETAYRKLGDRPLGEDGKALTSHWTAISFSLVGRLPVLDSTDLVAKVGAAHTSAGFKEHGSQVGLSRTGVAWGLGLDYKFSRDMSVRVMYDAYPEFAGGTESMSNISVGLKFRF